jgi:hypothetical protein
MLEEHGVGSWKAGFNLCAIVRLTIINEASQIAIWQASKHSSSSRIEDQNQIEYTCLDNGFYAILGTPNGASTMRMLRNHQAELGHRIVETIVVFGDKDLTMETAETRSMAILLSDRLSPLLVQFTLTAPLLRSSCSYNNHYSARKTSCSLVERCRPHKHIVWPHSNNTQQRSR